MFEITEEIELKPTNLMENGDTPILTETEQPIIRKQNIIESSVYPINEEQILQISPDQIPPQAPPNPTPN